MKVKIVDVSVQFKTLKIGDCFKVGDNLFIKTENLFCSNNGSVESPCNSVNLRSGATVVTSDSYLVIPKPNAVVTLE